MRRTPATLLFAAAFFGFLASADAAGKCGKSGCTGCQACQPQQNCGCGIETQYEAEEIVCYKTVFEEVREKKEVPTIKYVEERELREIVCTVCKPLPPAPCGPAAGCCAPATCCQPVQCCMETCIRKVPVPVYRPVPDKKVMEVVRIVEKQVPYTITCYKPICCKPEGCAAPAPSCTK